MKLVIIANRRRTCNWLGELVRRMERRFGAANVALELVDGSDLPGAGIVGARMNYWPGDAHDARDALGDPDVGYVSRCALDATITS